MFRITFEWLAFKCFEFLSNGLNLDSNALNTFRMDKICIQFLLIPFEWFEIEFECLESFTNSSNLHSNALDPFRMV